jgi:hypothetical protein
MPKCTLSFQTRRKKMTKKRQLLSEAQIRRMAAIAGIPALGTVSNIVSEKVKVDTTTETTETTEETNEVFTEGEHEGAGAEDEVPQEKIESLVDAVLAAIESETGVPAQRVDDEAPADDAPEMDAEEPEMEMGDEEPADEPEEEMMETVEPTLAERIAAAVQSVLDEDAAVAEGYKMEEDEEELEEGAHEDDEDKMKEGAHEDDEDKMKEGYGHDKDDDDMDEAHCNSKGKREDEDDLKKEETIDEITKAVVARLRSLQ